MVTRRAMTTDPMRRGLILLLLGLLPLAAARADEGAQEEEPTALTVFRAEIEKRVTAWKQILEETEAARRKLEATRVGSRTGERARTPTAEQRDWQKRWAATAADRVTIHNVLFRHFLSFSEPLLALFAVHAGKPLTPQSQAQVAKVCADRVSAWIEVGEPATLRGVLESVDTGIPRALALPGRDHPRRRLLGTVLARAAATPGLSDLDALEAAFSWAALFVAGRTVKEQLDVVSRDLILLLTERKEDGLSLSDGRYNKDHGFRDRGFGRRYRDGSNQLRHFAWAFRLFAASGNEEFTTRLLRMKEERDAKTRKQPVSEADLALNDAARRIVGRILGRNEGQEPLDAARWSELVRDELGK